MPVVLDENSILHSEHEKYIFKLPQINQTLDRDAVWSERHINYEFIEKVCLMVTELSMTFITRLCHLNNSKNCNCVGVSFLAWDVTIKFMDCGEPYYHFPQTFFVLK